MKQILIDTRDGRPELTYNRNALYLYPDTAEWNGITCAVEAANKKAGGDFFEGADAPPEALLDEVNARIADLTKSALHGLAVILNPEADYDRVRRAGMSGARGHNANSWDDKYRKAAAETLEKMKQAKREKSAALLAICLRDNAAEISHVTTRRMSEMGDPVLLVYRRDPNSPTGCWGTFGSFEICPETSEVLGKFETTATPGGRRGNTPNSTVGY